VGCARPSCPFSVGTCQQTAHQLNAIFREEATSIFVGGPVSGLRTSFMTRAARTVRLRCTGQRPHAIHANGTCCTIGTRNRSVVAVGGGTLMPPPLLTAGLRTRSWTCVTMACLMRIGQSRRRWTAEQISARRRVQRSRSQPTSGPMCMPTSALPPRRTRSRALRPSGSPWRALVRAHEAGDEGEYGWYAQTSWNTWLRLRDYR
jgi:hypothetical protein